MVAPHPRRHITVLALMTLAVSCGRVEPTSKPAAAPKASPIRVRPPVIRVAIDETRPLEELVGLPPEEVPTAKPPPPAPIPDDHLAAYTSSKQFSDLQPWRREVDLGEGRTLIDLHPRMHRQLFLTVKGATYSLENRSPESTLVDLDRSGPEGLLIQHLHDDTEQFCVPWEGSPSELESAAASRTPYVSICDDHLLVRNTVEGRRTTVEWATEFMRGVKGGDHLINLVKSSTQDRFRKEADLADGEATAEERLGPAPIALRPEMQKTTLARGDLGLPITPTGPLPAGHWQPVTDHPGIYTTLIAPKLLPIPEASATALQSTDVAEGGAVVFLAAIDLDVHLLEFEVGTEHPGVGWSPRAAPAMVDATRKGPDGINTVHPLGRTGQVPPIEALDLVASFTGGFKRDHGAFLSGELSKRNHASHYGLIQDGLVHSKLQPGLATLVVFDDGTVDIRTWSEDMNADLDRVLHARQNGAPILEAGKTGALLNDWRAGNWSGSATGEARTIRAGACIQQSDRGRHLVYGYFTSATPRAMAKVFLAAGCTDAIHLDMNALEHTYMAVYDHDPTGAWIVHHLDTGMAVLDKTDKKGTVLPRFVAFADNRDFFTVLRRPQ